MTTVKKKIYVTPVIVFEPLEVDDILNVTVSQTQSQGTTDDNNDYTGPGLGGESEGGDGMNNAKGGFFDWDEEW